jgi:hypothetical protein
MKKVSKIKCLMLEKLQQVASYKFKIFLSLSRYLSNSFRNLVLFRKSIDFKKFDEFFTLF